MKEYINLEKTFQHKDMHKNVFEYPLGRRIWQLWDLGLKLHMTHRTSFTADSSGR